MRNRANRIARLGLGVLFSAVIAGQGHAQVVNPPPVQAAPKAGHCYGTYLVDLNTPSVGIWTLSRDGTVQVTDSSEVFTGFSHEQGAWTRTVGNEARATFIDMTFDPNGPLPAGYARVDASLAFADGCNSLSGTLDLRLYESTGDPLDPNGGFQIGDDIPFTGRRVNP